MSYTLLFAQWQGQKYKGMASENVRKTIKMTEKHMCRNIFLDEEAVTLLAIPLPLATALPQPTNTLI